MMYRKTSGPPDYVTDIFSLANVNNPINDRAIPYQYIIPLLVIKFHTLMRSGEAVTRYAPELLINVTCVNLSDVGRQSSTSNN